MIDCTNTGQDGDIQAGGEWPEPRFEDNGNGTMTDHLTGLICLKNANCFGARTWPQALTDSSNLASGSCGLSDGSVAGDWHLPNRKELLSFVDYSNDSPALPNGHPFTGVQWSYYWSATTYPNSTNCAWYVDVYNGYLGSSFKSSSHYVWPVRNYLCGGDFDTDGDVDGSDLAVFAADFGRTDCETGEPCEGDFDEDGDVDGSDLAVFAADFGRTDCP